MIRFYFNIGADGTASYEKPVNIGRGGDASIGAVDFDDTFLGAKWANMTAGGEFLFTPGDTLEFDIKLPTPDATIVIGSNSGLGDTSRTTGKYGLDLKTVAGPWASDVPIVDQNGVDIAVGDKLPYADNIWYHITASLAPFYYKILEQVIAIHDEDGEFAYQAEYRHIYVKNGGVVRKVLFDGFFDPAEVARSPSYCMGLGSTFVVEQGVEGPLTVFGDFSADNVTAPYVSPSITVTLGTTYAVPDNVGTVYNNSSGGNMTMTLFAAAAVPAGRQIAFLNLHATNTLTIQAAGSDTINGGTSVGPYNQYEGITLASNGSTAFYTVV